MAVSQWLIDKSALVRLGAATDVVEWVERIDRGLVRISTVTLLEIGFSSRSAGDLRSQMQSPPLSAMPVEYVTPGIEDRALEVQLQLAQRGHHRGPSVPDLLLAAMAELNALTLLHVDRDFDVIAEITGQPVQRLTT
ncbi:MAG TPA: PIN domain nuclease [Candidatus Nanopelagicales bacterium]|nr:PIN domain nuclease [Candidatus Nanopelagicales bacterium]